MPLYRLSPDAALDIEEIASYTLEKWGLDIFNEYRDGLERTFQGIASGEVVGRNFSNRFPELYVAKHRFHYIFYITDGLDKPVIVGVIHERRDLVRQLNRRMDL
ncbi:type II toxin-antitoxin system RelE/ParE family toxin [Porticoccus sp. GXU_MW_L64]